MARPVKNSPGVSARNPKRSRERILAAALKEFAAKGFAGARVDFIARRAAINKRMLYHYFGNKEHLFREVLRLKMAERQAWAETLSGDPAESLAFWFEAACKDTDWVRLLEWEALQGDGQKVIDEKHRRAGDGARAGAHPAAAGARPDFRRVRSAPRHAGHAVADDVSGGVPAIDAAHHGPFGCRSQIPKGARRIFAPVRGGIPPGERQPGQNSNCENNQP